VRVNCAPCRRIRCTVHTHKGQNMPP